jgi:hypothetical protein
MESNQVEGAMEPSWTFPIPQAMQQHRGSQLHKVAPPSGKETSIVPAQPVRLAPAARPAEAERIESRDVIES